MRSTSSLASSKTVSHVPISPLDSGAASSPACRQGKKDIGRSQKKKEKKRKKGLKEDEDEDKDKDEDEYVIQRKMMVEE